MCGRGRVGGTRYRPRRRGPWAGLPGDRRFQDAESREQYASLRASVEMRSRPGRARRRRPGPTSISEPIRLRPGPASPVCVARRRGPVFRQCRWRHAHRARAYHGPARRPRGSGRALPLRPPTARGGVPATGRASLPSIAPTSARRWPGSGSRLALLVDARSLAATGSREDVPARAGPQNPSDRHRSGHAAWRRRTVVQVRRSSNGTAVHAPTRKNNARARWPS